MSLNVGKNVAAGLMPALLSFFWFSNDIRQDAAFLLWFENIKVMYGRIVLYKGLAVICALEMYINSMYNQVFDVACGNWFGLF